MEPGRRETEGADSGKPGIGAGRSNIYIVGFMGSGKSSVGRRLAELLGWAFLDLDEEIEKQEGKPIPEIFGLQGENHFRSLERRELGTASRRSRTVVALGGGAFCSTESQEIIAHTGISIWLDAPLEILFARCSACPSLRPLFAGIDEMAKLLERRIPSYTRAQIRVPVGSRSIDELARKILTEINQSEFPLFH